MERLTKQNIQNDGTIFYSQQQDYCRLLRCETNQKLGKLEDLEEQIGMPLDVFIKIKTHNICKMFVILNKEIVSKHIYRSFYNSFEVLDDIHKLTPKIIDFKYKDYNNTWFITHKEARKKLEELQKDKEV